MVRTVIAEGSLDKYLENLLEVEQFSYGIIIGQASSQGKDHVIHLARTPNDDGLADEIEATSLSKPTQAVDNKNVKSINAADVIDHALNAIRVLPGSFYILGIFVVSPKNVFDNSDDFKHLKDILKQLTDIFKTTPPSTSSLYGCSDEYDQCEKLIFNYLGGRSFTCKSINCSSEPTGNGKPVEWKFQDKLLNNWLEIETLFDTDTVLPLSKRSGTASYDIGENFDCSIEKIENQLKDCLIFINGEPLGKSDDCFLKQNSKNEPKTLQASIYSTFKEKDDEPTLSKYNGTIRYNGIVCSKIWIHSKNTVDEIQDFIKTDILRSISSRLRIYLDGYPVENYQNSPTSVLVGEPPRRVFYQLKSSPVYFSDYLFRGEDDETIVRQAFDVMDLHLSKDSILNNFETMADTTVIDDSYIDETDSSNKSTPQTAVNNHKSSISEANRFLYIIGTVFAVGILFISLGFHFIFNLEE